MVFITKLFLLKKFWSKLFDSFRSPYIVVIPHALPAVYIAAPIQFIYCARCQRHTIGQKPYSVTVYELPRWLYMAVPALVVSLFFALSTARLRLSLKKTHYYCYTALVCVPLSARARLKDWLQAFDSLFGNLVRLE